MAHLIGLNFTQEWIEDYMPTSRVHRLKLKGWQALVALAEAAAHASDSVVDGLLGQMHDIMLQNNHAQIRYYCELFMCKLLLRNPHRYLEPHLLSPLRQIEASTKSIASMLVVLLNTMRGGGGGGSGGGDNDGDGDDGGLGDADASFLQDDSGAGAGGLRDSIVTTVLPLLGASGSQLRILSQLIMHRLFPVTTGRGAGIADEDANKDDPVVETRPVSAVLAPILAYLRGQKDMVRMRASQERVFGGEDIHAKCTLKGLLSTKMDLFAEFYDPPALDRVKEACVAFQVESERLYPERFYYRHLRLGKLGKHGKAAPKAGGGMDVPGAGGSGKVHTTAMVEAAPLEEETEEEQEDREWEFNFQKKIQPWDTLDELARDMGAQRGRHNALDSRKKQQLVVVASLIDKVPNLGGLARTCEIFGASRLAIPSKTVCSNKLFQSVSVTAEHWLNIEEVPPEDLHGYLLGLQQQGYTLVGVEQTAQSSSLEAFTFPEKTVLLLGREKTGIPSKFIHMLDACVEIPQLGIVRSLNVHVSAALMVWEFTRQQLLSGRTVKKE